LENSFRKPRGQDGLFKATIYHGNSFAFARLIMGLGLFIQEKVRKDWGPFLLQISSGSGQFDFPKVNY